MISPHLSVLGAPAAWFADQPEAEYSLLAVTPEAHCLGETAEVVVDTVSVDVPEVEDGTVVVSVSPISSTASISSQPAILVCRITPFTAYSVLEKVISNQPGQAVLSVPVHTVWL